VENILAVASFFLSSFVTVFFVVDPPAAVPLFISMTATYPADEKRRMAIRASLISFSVLSVFAAAGGAIFRLLHVSLGAFRMAGGLLLFLLAVDMLRAQRSRQRTSPEEEAEAAETDDVSVFPLAIPMLAGPGATSAVMVLMTRAEQIWQSGAIFISIAVTAVMTYGILRFAGSIGEYLGQTGLNVLQRIMGLVLAAIAMQFVVDGIGTVLPSLAGAIREH
jgi:multiple antibiotic resistance protein